MSSDLREALFAELTQRREASTVDKYKKIGEMLINRVFPQQQSMILDKARQKAAICPRRSGKSYAALHYALWICTTRPGSKVLIVAKVRRQAKGVYWTKLKKICHELEIAFHPRSTELELELTETDSLISLTGADTVDEIEKFRGLDFDLVIIDEGKSYSAGLLKELIQDVIKPTLLDRRGTLLMIGTPGAILNGPFYEITSGNTTKDFGTVKRYEEGAKGRKAAWSLHGWTTADNVAAPWIWEAALEDKELNGWDDDHPTWRREYLAEWVPDDEAMVYAYAKANVNGRCNWEPDPESSNAFGLPDGHDWQYVLGVDLGYHDPTAFVVAAWADTHPDLFYVHSEKYSKMTVEEVAARTKQLEERFGSFIAKVADTGGLGKMLVESMAITYGVHFEAAKKSEKHAHFKLVNSDYESGRIKVIKYSALHEELVTLQYAGDDRKLEDPGCANHCCDAALYIWRWCYNHLFQAKKTGPEHGSDEWWVQREREAERAYRDELIKDKTSSYWEKYADKMNKNPWETAWQAHELKKLL